VKKQKKIKLTGQEIEEIKKDAKKIWKVILLFVFLWGILMLFKK